MSNEFYTYDNSGKLISNDYAYWVNKIGKIVRISDAIIFNYWFSKGRQNKILLYCWGHRTIKRQRILYFKMKD